MFSITIPSTAVGAGSQKQITIAVPPVNTIMYTVPTGRVFNGYFAVTSFGNGNYTILINGVNITVFYHYLATNGVVFMPPVPVKLVAGTVVTAPSANSSIGLFGVESDA